MNVDSVDTSHGGLGVYPAALWFVVASDIISAADEYLWHSMFACLCDSIASAAFNQCRIDLFFLILPDVRIQASAALQRAEMDYMAAECF
jgi:hypothetical protein